MKRVGKNVEKHDFILEEKVKESEEDRLLLSMAIASITAKRLMRVKGSVATP